MHAGERASGRQLSFLIRALCLMFALGFSRSPAASAGQPPIGIVDFYGLRTISVAEARQALRIKEGDVIPGAEGLERFKQDAEQRLESLPRVGEARLNFVCCNADKTILYVGIREKGTPALAYRTSPQGKVRLPEDVRKAGDDFQHAFMEAVEKRDFQEDDSQGYALDHYPAVHAVQEHFVILAAKNFSVLRDVLDNSSDPHERALAAQVIAYGGNRQAAAQDLAEAVHDPDGEVRNNATRALWLMARYAEKHPESHITISAEPFVDMVNSIDWTDRNKSSLVLVPLTESRDPALLRLLGKDALPSLVEMARWKAEGHAFGACVILGRIANLEEDTLKKQCSSDREAVISAAVKSSAAH